MANNNKKPKLQIKKVLEDNGISQYQLAKQLELQTQHITKMVKEDYNPTFKTLVKVAEAIDCRISDLIDE